MARIVLDPDDVNQREHVTLTDGTQVRIADADRALLGRIARQLATYAQVYADAYRPPDRATAERVAAGELPVGDVAPLHAAVARRHAQVRDEPGRGAADVDPTAVLDARRWTTSAGTARPLDELTPSHRRNLLAWLERHSDALRDAAAEALSPAQQDRIREIEPWVAGTPLHRALTALQEQVSGRELAIDQARQVARRIEFESTGRWPEA